MIRFFRALYSIIPAGSKLFILNDKVLLPVANLLIPIYFSVTNYFRRYELDKEDIPCCRERVIVSLTSFPTRIGRLYLVVESLLRQSRKPDMIILWLSKSQFPSMESLPKSLLKLRDRGLSIELRDDDLRSHKKYYYAFKECPNDVIVTVDDDIYYASNMLSELLVGHALSPKCVCCSYGCVVGYDAGGSLLPYASWRNLASIADRREIDGGLVFFGSGGGTLFPPRILCEDVTNATLSQELTPTADDVWLNGMCHLSGVEVRFVASNALFLPVSISSNETLSEVNNDGLESQNDIQIKKLRNHYCSSKLFCKR